MSRAFRRPRGLSTFFVLLALSLMMVLGVGISTIGLANLDRGAALRDGRLAHYAAQAGVQAAVRELVLDKAWSAGFESVALNADQTYSVRVTNNFAGSAAATASNGAVVPPGAVYLLAEGRARGGAIRRNLGVLARPTNGRFPHAIGLGGAASLGPATIRGTVKLNGKATLTSNVDVSTAYGSGRFLGAGDLDVSAGTLSMDTTEDVRVRGAILPALGAVTGTTEVYSADLTSASKPFVTDGRTTNNPPAGEEVMPNPDTAQLLAPGYVDHGSVTSIEGTLDLAGKVHSFPNGVTFGAGAALTGRGTIVVGNAQKLEFLGPVGSSTSPVAVNLVALDGSGGTVGGARIVFQAASYVNGVVYSQGTVTVNAPSKIRGALYCYPNSTGSLTATAHLEVANEDLAASLPGFDAWLPDRLLRVQSTETL